MKIGILSDSHGHVQPVRAALQLLDAAGAQGFIHCGDVGNMEVIEELAGRRAWFVRRFGPGVVTTYSDVGGLGPDQRP